MPLGSCWRPKKYILNYLTLSDNLLMCYCCFKWNTISTFICVVLLWFSISVLGSVTHLLFAFSLLLVCIVFMMCGCRPQRSRRAQCSLSLCPISIICSQTLDELHPRQAKSQVKVRDFSLWICTPNIDTANKYHGKIHYSHYSRFTC